MVYMLLKWLSFFFFSSRRRHTRYWRDWSSDVCSSDLGDEDQCDFGPHSNGNDEGGGRERPLQPVRHPKFREPVARVQDQRDNGRAHAVEDSRHPWQPAEVDVERPERRDDDEVRQDERPPAGPRTPEAAADVGNPDADLGREGSRERLTDGDALTYLLLDQPLPMGTRRGVCSRSIGDPPRPVSGSVTLDASSIKRYAGTAMRWLMLLMSLPPTPTRHRVGVWRKLQRMGAVRLRGSAWILPETPETTELFQWLVQEIQSFRGEATLVHVDRIEAIAEEQVRALCHNARGVEYQAVVQGCREILSHLDRYRTNHRGSVAKLRAKLDGFKRALDRIQAIE